MSPTTARCLRCPWIATGSSAHVEREARRHTGDGLAGGPGHPTVTATAPTTATHHRDGARPMTTPTPTTGVEGPA